MSKGEKGFEALLVRIKELEESYAKAVQALCKQRQENEYLRSLMAEVSNLATEFKVHNMQSDSGDSPSQDAKSPSSI